MSGSGTAWARIETGRWVFVVAPRGRRPSRLLRVAIVTFLLLLLVIGG